MELHVSLSGRRDLSGEIYRQVRRAIADGRLRPGEALPPTRHLARRLSVSRMTVTVAYERLASEGLVIARVGAGTFVSAHAARPSARRPRESRQVLAGRALWQEIPLPAAFGRLARYDFRTGIPDATLFPHRAWNRLVARCLRRTAVTDGLYRHPAGQGELRAAIARHVGISRGVAAEADDVTITNGTQQALDVLARVLLAPGETVAVEDPGYTPPRRLFHTLGLRVVGVPVDGDGLIVDAIPRGVRAVYVTPSHHYPLGVCLSLARRQALLAWADRHHAAIIEDDYDSEFRFGGRPLEALQTLDGAGRVIYVGSFSKTMLPGLRLGFVVTPPSLTPAVHRAKYVTDWHTPILVQDALARFIDDGGFARHVRRVSAVYRARHEMITRVVARDFAGVLDLVPSSTGLHVAARARRLTVQQIEVARARAAEAGVAVQPLSMFAVGRARLPGVVLGYGAIATAGIEEGLRLLRACLPL
ncbi:MAG: PLP-dependent aminotransferase family protein [Vicinamibacterales bacterium]